MIESDFLVSIFAVIGCAVPIFGRRSLLYKSFSGGPYYAEKESHK